MLNVKDFICLWDEYQEALKGCKDLKMARRYKQCINELEAEIAKRQKKNKSRLPRRIAA